MFIKNFPDKKLPTGRQTKIQMHGQTKQTEKHNTPQWVIKTNMSDMNQCKPKASDIGCFTDKEYSGVKHV